MTGDPNALSIFRDGQDSHKILTHLCTDAFSATALCSNRD